MCGVFAALTVNDPMACRSSLGVMAALLPRTSRSSTPQPILTSQRLLKGRHRQHNWQPNGRKTNTPQFPLHTFFARLLLKRWDQSTVRAQTSSGISAIVFLDLRTIHVKPLFSFQRLSVAIQRFNSVFFFTPSLLSTTIFANQTAPRYF